MTALVIAGGGLAGAAAACELAQSGRRVVVLERSQGPTDKICGDFLSAEAQHYVRRLGLDPHGMGGHSISRVRVIRGQRQAESRLPFTAIGLSRRVLDEALLRHAEASGAEIRRGVTIARHDPGIHFLATGKHDLRGAARKPRTEPEDLVGFKLYLRLSVEAQRDLAGTVEIILFAQGYAGLQLVEGETANLCLLIRRDHLASVGGTWPALLAALIAEQPHLRARLHNAQSLLPRPLSIARVPYGFIHTPTDQDTMFRLGDQACVIPSFTGDGMSMALHSAALAVQHHLAGQSPAAYHRRLAADVTRPISRATTLYRLGRTPFGQALLIRALQAWPGLLHRTAAATRVPQPAWLRTQVQE